MRRLILKNTQHLVFPDTVVIDENMSNEYTAKAKYVMKIGDVWFMSRAPFFYTEANENEVYLVRNYDVQRSDGVTHGQTQGKFMGDRVIGGVKDIYYQNASPTPKSMFKISNAPFKKWQ